MTNSMSALGSGGRMVVAALDERDGDGAAWAFAEPNSGDGWYTVLGENGRVVIVLYDDGDTGEPPAVVAAPADDAKISKCRHVEVRRGSGGRRVGAAVQDPQVTSERSAETVPYVLMTRARADRGQ